MTTRLAARNIQVRYAPDTPLVVSQFSEELKSGVFVGIIGPNGSGKSTAIRALSRTLRPSDGVVLLDERDLYTHHSARSSAQAIGVMPQDTGVSLDFSVRDVVRMGRAPHLPQRPFASETPEDEKIVDDALQAAQAADLAERAVTTLSGGERQRVLFARALAQQAEILLLDEPTASLDLRHQTKILTLARNLAHRGGKAVLAVLHDVNLAATYCDRLVLLHGGKVAASGTPAEVLTAENFQIVYGARVWVRPHPVTGRPLMLSLPEPPLQNESAEAALHVHVICGGGTGAGLLPALLGLGFTVSAAGLHSGDPDAEAAQALGIPFAQESAFSLLSFEVLEQAAHLAQSSEIVLVTETPFGRANITNLEAALALHRAGKPIICIQRPEPGFAARDFTGGRAAKLWSALQSAGAVVLPTNEAALNYLGNPSHLRKFATLP